MSGDGDDAHARATAGVAFAGTGTAAATARPPGPASASTRERLLAAAHDLTAEGGYAAASVAAVASRAGLATGTLYRHWPSKGELLADLFTAVCAGELSAMRDAADHAAGRGAAAQAEAVLQTFAGRALRAPRLAWALLAEPVDPRVEAERLVYRRAYRELLAGLVRAGVAGGELPDQDPDLVAAVLVGGMGEALVGPLADPTTCGDDVGTADLLAGLGVLTRRTLGAEAPGGRGT